MKTNQLNVPTAGEIARQIADMAVHGYPAPGRRISIRIPQAREVLRAYLSYLLGSSLQWLPEYDHVADWLTDNHGQGLLLAGDCGRGKSLICERVMPLIMQRYKGLIVKSIRATQLPQADECWLRYRLVAVDDVGTEDVSMRYGNRRDMFAELVDAAEKEDHLLLLTCNYGSEGLARRYGLRVVDRLRGLVRGIRFSGPSLRRK